MFHDIFILSQSLVTGPVTSAHYISHNPSWLTPSCTHHLIATPVCYHFIVSAYLVPLFSVFWCKLLFVYVMHTVMPVLFYQITFIFVVSLYPSSSSSLWHIAKKKKKSICSNESMLSELLFLSKLSL